MQLLHVTFLGHIKGAEDMQYAKIHIPRSISIHDIQCTPKLQKSINWETSFDMLNFRISR